MSATLIDQQITDRLASDIAQLRKDVDALKSNQVKQLVFPDATTNRILIDGLNGEMEISLPGFDVTTGLPSTELLFSTNFGSIVESHYRLTADANNTNSSTFIFPGIFGLSTAMVTSITLSDYKNILFYLEANIGGTANAQCEVHLYNATTAAVVSGSTIDSPQSTADTLVRSSAITLASGTNQYYVEYKRVGGTSSDFITLAEAHLVTRITL